MFKKIVLLLFFTLFGSVTTQANTKSEIDHLLNYVQTTQCTYLRNGDAHTGKEAAAHIQKKYDYFKEDIGSAEDFIRLSASKSTMTGSKYYIQCPGAPRIESSKWLTKELYHYRKMEKK